MGRALRGALQREKGERGRARLAEENATVCAEEEEPVSVEEGVTVARVPVSPLCVEDPFKVTRERFLDSRARRGVTGPVGRSLPLATHVGKGVQIFRRPHTQSHASQPHPSTPPPSFTCRSLPCLAARLL